jgi:FKBP-type peptidyl-prolyl cis-trans isomerase
MKVISLLVIGSAFMEASVGAFSLNNNNRHLCDIKTSTQINAEHSNKRNHGRRQALNTLVTSGFIAATSFIPTEDANALVEGNPVPGKSPKKSLPEEYRQGTSALADMDANAAVPESAYHKLPSGVIYADLREGGTGDVIGEGSRVNLQWVLRKSNGYFVDSSEVQAGVPFIFTVGDKKAIDGLDEGVRGMRQGGTRRLLIPPSLAYSKGLDDGCPGPLPAGFGPRQQMRRVQNVRKDVPGEYVFLEVQVTRVR